MTYHPGAAGKRPGFAAKAVIGRRDVRQGTCGSCLVAALKVIAPDLDPLIGSLHPPGPVVTVADIAGAGTGASALSWSRALTKGVQMPVQDKISEIAFTQDTGLSPAQIRAAGLRALEAGKRFMTTTLTEGVVGESGIQYLGKGPGGFVTQMVMQVGWTETGDGRRSVSFTVSDCLTLQSKFLMFIPTGPKRAPALPSAQRFAQALRAELAAA